MASFPTFPAFPSVDFSKLDLSGFDPSKLALAQLDGLQFAMPNIKLPRVDTETVKDVAKEAGYIAVGLAVLAVQKAQVHRQDLRKSLDVQVDNGRSQLAELVDAVEAGLASLDSRLMALESKVDGAVESLEKRLPDKAGAALGQALEVVKVVRQQARTLLTPAA